MIVILNKKQKEQLINEINQYFDSEFSTDDEIFLTQQNKIYLITKEALMLPLEKLKIRNMGMYFGQKIGKEIRLSVGGSNIILKTANKRVIEINNKQLELLKNDRIKIEEFFDKNVENIWYGFNIIKFQNFALGCIRITKEEIINYISKSRRHWL